MCVRLDVSGQLIEAATGVHLWAERYDGSTEDVFGLQDEITASVVGALTPRLERAEMARVRRKPTESLDAYDLFLRALESVRTATLRGNDEAVRLCRASIALDPEFASAYAVAAMCYGVRKTHNWVVDREYEIAEASRLARRAVECASEDGWVLAYAGHALAYVVGDLDAGARLSERALSHSPNFAPALVSSAFINIWSGKPDLAVERLTRAIRLSPLEPSMPWWHATMAHAHFHAERFEEALVWVLRALSEREDVDAVRLLAATYGHLRRTEQARAALARLGRLDPTRRISNLPEVLGPYRPEGLDRYSIGLRVAGLPE
jgi:tetratricopeptide (TPR) repeat protein